MKKAITYLVSLAIIVYAFLCDQYGWNFLEFPNDTWEPSPQVNAEALRATIVTPVPDTRIIPEKNIVYCATTQLAWNELCRIFKGTIEFEPKPDYLDALNLRTREDMTLFDSDYRLTASTLGRKIIERGSLGVMKDGMTVNDTPPEKSRDIVIEAKLFKQSKFEKEFSKSIIKFKSGNATIPVRAFTTEDAKNTMRQVEICAFQLFDRNGKELEKITSSLNKTAKNHFIFKLITTNASEEIVISSYPPRETLASTFHSIEKLIHEPRETSVLKPGTIESTIRNASINLSIDGISVPCLNFNILKNFPEVADKPFKGHDKTYIKEFIQTIMLILNEKGATLESTAKLTVRTGYRFFLNVDGPFVIYMKEKRSPYPYFIAYIANEELMVKK